MIFSFKYVFIFTNNHLLHCLLTNMDAIIANLKSQLGDIIKEEVKNTMTRLRGKICKAMEVEEPEVDLQKFAENTLKKIMEESAELFSKTEEDMKKLTVKAPKLKKDPDAPKPAVNAYIMYSRDNRADVKEENPELKATEITKKLAEMWQSADQDLKQEYKDKAEQDKKRYDEELETYEPKEGFQNPKEKKSSKKKKKSGPSKPLNAYMWFCKDKRDELKGKFNNTEILRELGRLWKNLSEKKKKPYVEKAEQDKERYQDEMKDYVPAEGEEKNEKKGKGKKSVKSDGTKRPMSAYLLFCKDKRAVLKENEPELKQPEIMKKLGEMWKSASQKEKKKYTDQSAKLLAEFKSKNEPAGKAEEEVEEEVEDKVEDKSDEEVEEEVESDDDIVLPQTGTPKKCMPNIVSDAKFAAMKEAEKKKQMDEKKRSKKSKKDESDDESDESDKKSKKAEKKSEVKTSKSKKDEKPSKGKKSKKDESESDDESDKKSKKSEKPSKGKKEEKKGKTLADVVDMDTQLYDDDDEPLLSDDE